MDMETMVCVGGPMDGRRAHVVASARYAEFLVEPPCPRLAETFGSATATYETLTMAASATEHFRILVPAGTKPAIALRCLIDGYREQYKPSASEFYPAELLTVARD